MKHSTDMSDSQGKPSRPLEQGKVLGQAQRVQQQHSAARFSARWAVERRRLAGWIPAGHKPRS